jgi:hypothetical protein
MNRLFVTGDLHCPLDIKKLDTFNNENKLDETDIFVILGDAGLLWDDDGERKEWIQKIEHYPFTTFVIAGNHENYDMIEKLPRVMKYNGAAREVHSKLFYDVRGEVYNFNGRLCLTVSGGNSVDKDRRVAGVSWWPQEQIEIGDIKTAKRNLSRYNNNIDYIFTHVGTSSVVKSFGFNPDSCVIAIDEILCNIKYKHHYFGHYHIDKNISQKQTILYDDFIELN